ncbi:MAG: hypothetical protein WC792_00100 [Candidatus Micrarchaeia archaeon]
MFFAQYAWGLESVASGLRGVDRVSGSADDVSRDLQDFLEFNASVFSVNAGVAGPVVVRTWDRVPSTLRGSNFGQLLSDYASFVSGNVSASGNLNLSLGVSGFSANPFVYFAPVGLNHSYSSFDKTRLSVFGNSQVSNYSVFVQSAGGDSFEGCGWFSQHTGATLNATVSFAQISQPPCNPASVMLDGSQASVFWFNTSSGKVVNVTFGLLGGFPNSMGLEVNSSSPVDMRVRVDTAVASPNAVYGWIPVSLNFTGQGTFMQNLFVLRG